MMFIGITACTLGFFTTVVGFIVNWGDGDRNNSLRAAAILYLVLMSFSTGVHVGGHSKEREEKPTVDAPEKEIAQGFIKQKEEE